MEVIVSRGAPQRSGKPKNKEELEKMRTDANRLVKGIFRCHEPPGGEVTLVWKEYKGDPIRRWTLKDGTEYELPLGLARHLNKNVGYFEHSHIVDVNGNPLINRKNKRVARMNFESLEFYA